MIGLVDCDLGNLRSVANALDCLGQDVSVLTTPAGFDDCSHLILPGVGSFAVASARLRDRGLAAAIQAFARSGRPVLGICLGMQLLAESGEEGGTNPGLGLVSGTVVRFDSKHVPMIPHVGWNDVHFNRAHPLLTGVKDGVDVYFVHSYYLPANEAQVLGEADCGQRFAAIVARDNIGGCQFHPEKSQANGLRMLENFCDWNGQC